MTRIFTVRTNCEYRTDIEVRDDQGADDAIAIADKTDVGTWDKSWAPMEAEEE